LEQFGVAVAMVAVVRVVPSVGLERMLMIYCAWRGAAATIPLAGFLPTMAKYILTFIQ
jgi:hypothetical protein